MSIVIQAAIEPTSTTKTQPCDHDCENYNCDSPLGDDFTRDGSRCNASMPATESFCFTWGSRNAQQLTISIGDDSYRLTQAELVDLVNFFDAVHGHILRSAD
jgi:hypothetical protein